MVLGFAVPLAIIIYYDMQEPAGISSDELVVVLKWLQRRQK